VSKATKDRADVLASQRESLRKQCALQRLHLSESAAAIEQQFGGVDRAVRLVRGLASKPTLITVGIAALTLIGPKRALRWISQGAFWYTTGKRFAQVLSASGVMQRKGSTPRSASGSPQIKNPRLREQRRAPGKPQTAPLRRARMITEKSSL
jgi:hypothetical protein